jgi:predicted DNA-binding antitoxin AbrB/MazE fold protein
MDEGERSEFVKSTVHAIYENGIFRPVEPVDLPENTAVDLDLRVPAEARETAAPAISEGLAKIYEILGRRYNSGYTDTAARHNEHQP